MNSLTCPSCGAAVTFQSAVTVFTVCAYCQSTLLRTDLKLENLGKMALLKEDATPIQLNTSGKYNKESFTVIGRVRKSWEAGFWNEWFLYFDGVKYGWLAEAQGFYGITIESEIEAPDLKTLTIGNDVTLKQDAFVVDDIKENWISYAEGELPSVSPFNKRSITVDLVSETAQFGSIEYEDTTPRVFIGSYIDFDDLNFQNLRTFDGW